MDKPISVEEIKSMLKKAKLNKAPGEDRITYEFFINATNGYLEQLASIYNRMFSECCIDEAFNKTIIFPIFKKGDINQPSNYRGISFMNCVAKIMMGILNARLYTWVEKNNILTEYQAGFRKKYSTVDNIYNLASIVHLKLEEKKKVYAFFIDLKAAFDKISRKLLIYKLHEMGVSTKFVNFIERIYLNTQSAVWTGHELSEYFETLFGVKQGCLLSPLLFALYINDLDKFLGGALNIESLNIRLLLYADDMVILAEDIKVMQRMINKLEEYCERWSLEVNLSKSEIMVFRNGGRLSHQENWIFKGERIRIVSHYTYLGILLTPKMTFAKHVEKRNTAAKSSINATWQCFLAKRNIPLRVKWKLFQAVCRAIQAYSAQVWGFGMFEEVDKLQRYFLKRVLKLPSCTPNYALSIETGAEDGHFYTLDLHLRYISKTIFEYDERRLPHQLSKILLRKQFFWVKEINKLGHRLGLHWDENVSQGEWKRKCLELLRQLKSNEHQEYLRRATESNTRFYRKLDHSKGQKYFIDEYDLNKITWIFKARCDLIRLNGNCFGRNNTLCTLCNMREEENIQHFLGVCPVLKEFRLISFGTTRLTESTIIRVLNGEDTSDWEKLTKYITAALAYRNMLIQEFN